MTSIYRNSSRRLRAATNLLELAAVKGVSNSKKSIYYQSAMILYCSIAEALTYELVRNLTISSGHVVSETTEYKELLRIKSKTLSSTNDLFICLKNKKNLLLDDADFGKYLIFLKNNKSISYPKYVQLNWVRVERNKIHMQGIQELDVGYTKKKIERVANCINYLLDKI